MNVTTTARHCDLDPEVRLFAHQRLERLFRFVRDPRDLMEAHVVVSAEKFRHTAEITVKLRRDEIVSREEANDPRAAIDLATDRLEQQLRRIKERRADRQRGDGTRAADRIVLPELPEDEAGDGDGSGVARED